MQATKDTFYVTLRNRLAKLDPARTITVDGVERPAILVAENEPPTAEARLQDAFYLQWGAAQAVRPAISALMQMECVVSYASSGTEPNGGKDRGRALGNLDSDLLGISTPACAAKTDYSSGAPADLGTTIFWSAPVAGATRAEGPRVARENKITVYFYPEVTQS